MPSALIYRPQVLRDGQWCRRSASLATALCGSACERDAWLLQVNHPDADKYDTSSLRAVGGGGAATAPKMVAAVTQRFKNASPSQVRAAASACERCHAAAAVTCVSYCVLACVCGSSCRAT